MKNVKKYFKMIITAVICFAMSLIPGKKVSAKVLNTLADGQAVSGNTKRSPVNTKIKNVSLFNSSNEKMACRSNRRRLYLKKVFFWLQGPGDRAGGAGKKPKSPNAPPGHSPVRYEGSG